MKRREYFFGIVRGAYSASVRCTVQFSWTMAHGLPPPRNPTRGGCQNGRMRSKMFWRESRGPFPVSERHHGSSAPSQSRAGPLGLRPARRTRQIGPSNQPAAHAHHVACCLPASLTVPDHHHPCPALPCPSRLQDRCKESRGCRCRRRAFKPPLTSAGKAVTAAAVIFY
jgi:hypothetical protein